MKRSTKITQLAIFLILGSISCSKVPEVVPEADSATKLKHTAQTSSIVGYFKDNTTTVTSLGTNPSNIVKKVLYSIGPLTVQADDVVTVHFQQELTYSSNYNTMIGAAVVVAASATDVSGTVGMAAKTGTQNMTYGDELGVEVVSRTGSYKFTAAASNIYINAVCYAANLHAVTTAPDITVPPGAYGELVAVIESNVTRYETTAVPVLPLDAGGKWYDVAIDNVKRIHHTYGPLSIPANTQVDVRYETEATTETAMPVGNYAQRFGRWVSEGSSSSDKTGSRLTRPMQVGITHTEHHNTLSHAGGKFYGSAATNMYFNSVVYGNGWSGGPLRVEKPSTASYGRMVVELRPSSSGNFFEDVTRNITIADATQRVLYSVGPIDIDANQVVEIRYQAAFQPSALTTVDSKIVRATSATATTGVLVQPPLARVVHNNYVYSNMIQSTAERPTTAQTGQYYNVVVWRIGGAATLPVLDWGELEVIKR